MKRSKPESTVVVTFPNYSGCSKSPTYNLFCKYSLIKYSSWSIDDLEDMENEENAVERWKYFLETSHSDLIRYCHEDVELRKLLVEARDRGDYEMVEEQDCEHDFGEPEQWMVAAGMIPNNG